MLRGDFEFDSDEKARTENLHSVSIALPKRLWLSNLFFVLAIHLGALLSLVFVTPKLGTVYLCMFLWQASGLGTRSNQFYAF